MNRREFLRVGAVGALTLANALRLRAAERRLRNCILIWLDGGPSHLDTFDLKPDAAAEVRGDFQPIDTNVAGIQICEHFRRLSQVMDRVCLIRSLTSELGEHNFGRHYLLTGYKPTPVLTYPSYGAVLAHGRTRQTGGLPPYVGVPEAVAGSRATATCPPRPGPSPCWAIPASPTSGSRPGRPARLRPRLERRREFLNDFDTLQPSGRGRRQPPRRDAQLEQAYRLILSPAAKQAFDLGREKADGPSALRHAAAGPIAACWPGGWSRPAAPSSRSTTGLGHAPADQPQSEGRLRRRLQRQGGAARPGLVGPARRPGASAACCRRRWWWRWASLAARRS